MPDLLWKLGNAEYLIDEISDLEYKLAQDADQLDARDRARRDDKRFRKMTLVSVVVVQIILMVLALVRSTVSLRPDQWGVLSGSMLVATILAPIFVKLYFGNRSQRVQRVFSRYLYILVTAVFGIAFGMAVISASGFNSPILDTAIAMALALPVTSIPFLNVTVLSETKKLAEEEKLDHRNASDEAIAHHMHNCRKRLSRLQETLRQDVLPWYPQQYAYPEAAKWFVLGAVNHNFNTVEEMVSKYEDYLHRQRIQREKDAMHAKQQRPSQGIYPRY